MFLMKGKGVQARHQVYILVVFAMHCLASSPLRAGAAYPDLQAHLCLGLLGQS